MPGMLVIESAANTVMVRVAKIEALERDGTQVSLHTVSGCHAFRFDRGEKAAAFVMAIVERLRAVERAEVEA